MKKEARLAARNSVIFVMDQTVGEVPESMSGSSVAATESCVAIGTLSEMDGETSITLSDEGPEFTSGLSNAFDGILSTPSRQLSACSVDDIAIMSIDVPSSSTRVRIWTNDASEPDRIHIHVLSDTKQ